MALSASSTFAQLDVRPLANSLGAEIRGIDLRSLSDEEWGLLHEAWLKHLVLLFPQQHLSPDEHITFARRFGEPDIHPYIEKLDEDHPEIAVLDSDTGGRVDIWHTDVTFSPTPPKASILQMKILPSCGGDTMWSNQYMAYEALSAPMRELIDNLTAMHNAGSYGKPEVKAVHPVVRVHPETGRRSLFVNRLFTKRIIELQQYESDMLLQALFTWSATPEFQFRYKWSEGTVAIWDNRCTQHYAVSDYDERRVINRVTVAGDAPFGSPPRWEPYRDTRPVYQLPGAGEKG